MCKVPPIYFHKGLNFENLLFPFPKVVLHKVGSESKVKRHQGKIRVFLFTSLHVTSGRLLLKRGHLHTFSEHSIYNHPKHVRVWFILEHSFLLCFFSVSPFLCGLKVLIKLQICTITYNRESFYVGRTISDFNNNDDNKSLFSEKKRVRGWVKKPVSLVFVLRKTLYYRLRLTLDIERGDEGRGSFILIERTTPVPTGSSPVQRDHPS